MGRRVSWAQGYPPTVGSSRDLPVIVLTAHASARNAITALKLGAFDFIVKGLAPDLVVLAVHRAVRHRRNAVTTRRETEWLRARIAEVEGRQQVT